MTSSNQRLSLVSMAIWNSFGGESELELLPGVSIFDNKVGVASSLVTSALVPSALSVLSAGFLSKNTKKI
jgi:hypothetical protein